MQAIPANIQRLFILFPILAIILCIPWTIGKAQPIISHILPDIGTPNLNTYIELIGPSSNNGNFGKDSIYLNNSTDAVQVVCSNASDSTDVKIGPCVVSWDGKMISTHIFVMPWVNAVQTDWKQARKIPLKVIVNGVYSNTDTFFIVKSQSLGSNGILNLPGILGQGIQNGLDYGFRSKRGAMIVDSINLKGNGIYSISMTDCDPYSKGNQGYLPFVLISKGNLSMANGASLTADGKKGVDSGHGGPGGGGGGNGLTCGTTGGNGFTGGGGNNDWQTGCGDRPSGIATGFSQNAINGTLGGQSSTSNEGGGGGTGHPFGIGGGSGGAANWNGGAPGFGGASGGPNCCEPAQQGGGGGGAFATSGKDGGIWQGFVSGGQSVGNIQLIPVAGGSGGGGGNVNAATTGPNIVGAGNGGGGGGSISLYSRNANISLITSKGGRGETSANNGAGGGGSGGSILVGAKELFVIQTLDVDGGVGGFGFPTNAGQNGGGGGAGRIRIDGIQNQNASINPVEATIYNGPSTDNSDSVFRTFTLTGSGNGNDIRIYLRSLSGYWIQAASISGYGATWSKEITLPECDSIYLLVVAQNVRNPNSSQYLREPSWVLSQAGANILKVRLPNYSLRREGKQKPCEGDTISLVVNGKNVITQWTKNGINILGSNDSSIKVYSSGIYSVLLKDTMSNCITILSDTITLQSLPKVELNPSGITSLCPGDSAILSVVANGKNITWKKNGKLLSNNDSSMTVGDSGIYTVVVADSNSCEGFASDTIEILPAVHLMLSGDQTPCQGNEVWYSNASAIQGQHKWSASGGTILSRADSEYVLIRWDSTGIFNVYEEMVTATCTGKDSLQVTVIPRPIAMIQPKGIRSLCLGSSDSLWSSTGASSYEWKDTLGNIVSIDSLFIAAQPGYYTLSITNSNGCRSDLDSILVFQQLSPVLSVQAIPDHQKSGDTVFIRVNLGQIIPSFPVDQIRFNLHWNSDLLSPLFNLSTSCFGNLTVLPKPLNKNDVECKIDFSQPTMIGGTGICELLRIPTIAYITDTLSTTIDYDSLSINFHSSLKPLEICSDSIASFTLIPECGEPSISRSMAGQDFLYIKNIIPNPASSKISIELHVPITTNGGCAIGIYDPIGKLIKEEQLPFHTGKTDLSYVLWLALESGQYYIRVSNSAGTSTKTFTVIK
jgi:hypothetical protein